MNIRDSALTGAAVSGTMGYLAGVGTSAGLATGGTAVATTIGAATLGPILVVGAGVGAGIWCLTKLVKAMVD